MLFIDELSHKGFCCETCIEDFYRPIVKHFKDRDLELRKKLNIASSFDEFFETEEALASITTSADEVYLIANELGDRFYTFIKKQTNFYSVVITSMYQKEVSFYFFNTQTTSQEHLKEYRKGELIDNFLNKKENALRIPTQEIESDEELLSLIEQKKSALLADLLTARIDSDIDFERFFEFEDCFNDTVSVPDEIYENKDKEGDVVVNFIRAFPMRDGVLAELFYYVVTFIRVKNEEGFELLPILGFPTIDYNFLKRFKVGTIVSGPTKN